MSSRRAVLKGGVAALATATLGVAGTGRSAGATSSRWEQLRRHLSGDLVLPDEAGYDVAKQLHWMAFDSVRPAGVAYCATVHDVRTCLAFAQHNGIRAVPRSGGHSFGGYSTTTGLVIDVSRLNDIQVGERTTVVGPGAQLVDVVDAAAAHGFAHASGLCPTVAMGGYLHGGGIGYQTRALGLGCDSLRSAQVVLADGRVVECSERTRPDLFWALRGGGGGNFGIVTRYERRNSTIPRMTNFTLAWTWDHALLVMDSWQQWSSVVPRTLGSRWLIGLLDAAPGAFPFIVVDGLFLGSPEELAPHLDALAAAVGRPPAFRNAQELGFRDGMMTLFRCNTKTVAECHRVGAFPNGTLPRSGFTIQRSRLFTQNVPAAGLAEIVAAFDAERRAGQLRLVTGFALGGAANDIPRTATAYVHRDTLFTMDWGVVPTSPTATDEDRAAARAWIDNAFAVTDRYSAHETYQNYIDPALPDWRQSYYAENYARLVAMKRRYDPDGFFSFAQSIG